jgi:hypothetical protein
MVFKGTRNLIRIGDFTRAGAKIKKTCMTGYSMG